MKVEPYLSFEGRCEEAIEFYKAAIGAKVEMLSRFKECPEPQPGAHGPEIANKIMHASLRMGDSVVMMSDGRCAGQSNFHGTSLTITASNDAEADRVFTALSAGGKVNMPLTKTFFSSKFGMLNDRFAVPWMIIVQR